MQWSSKAVSKESASWWRDNAWFKKDLIANLIDSFNSINLDSDVVLTIDLMTIDRLIVWLIVMSMVCLSIYITNYTYFDCMSICARKEHQPVIQHWFQTGSHEGEQMSSRWYITCYQSFMALQINESNDCIVAHMMCMLDVMMWRPMLHALLFYSTKKARMWHCEEPRLIWL